MSLSSRVRNCIIGGVLLGTPAAAFAFNHLCTEGRDAGSVADVDKTIALMFVAPTVIGGSAAGAGLAFKKSNDRKRAEADARHQAGRDNYIEGLLKIEAASPEGRRRRFCVYDGGKS
jgi:hypothetical protein